MFQLKCYRFLRSVRAMSDDPDQVYKVSRDRTYCYPFRDDEHILESDEIPFILGYLKDGGYITMPNASTFLLTYRGFHPFAIDAAILVQEIVRSVIFPCIVALITALVTLWITSG